MSEHGIGHNSCGEKESPDLSNRHLKSFMARIENLEEERKTLRADIREVYSEAKSMGFDPKIMRKVIALRRMDDAERQENQALMEVYMEALGMLADTPLGQAALRKAG